jgi:hypothetical protein
MSVTKTIEIEARVDKAEKDLEGVAKSVQKIDKNLEDVKDSSKVAAKGIKGIGTALKAAGIGLVIAAFGKLVEVFNENQKVADAFSITFEALSLGFNDFFNFLDRNAGTVIDYFKGIFNDPKQAAIDLGKAIKDNIIERFNSTLDMLGYLSKAFKQVFEGDFDGAMQSAKMAGKEYVDVLTGVDGSVDKVASTISKAATGIADYTKNTLEAAISNVNLTKSAEVAAVKQQGLVEKYDRQAELQRQIRDDESKSIEERVAANTKLGEILDEQEAAMLKQVDVQLQAAQAQYDKNGNQENYIALLEAQNEKEAVQAQIAGFRSEQLTNINSLERERLDLIEEAKEKTAEDIEIENERIAAIQKLTDFQILTAVEKLQRDRDTALAELELLNATEEQKQKVRDHYAKEETKLAELTTNQKLKLAGDALGNIAKIAGEQSKVGKAAAIAQATISTFLGAQEAFTSLAGIPIVGPALGALAAGAAIVSGIQTVKQIRSTKTPSGGSSGGGSSISTPSRATASSAPPAFNVVGASETNQLAQSIGQDEKQPVKAYVVSNEVSDAQALDRNIVESASIG